MAKPLAAILKSYSDVIAGKLPASEVNKLTLGKEPGVDYDPKMPDEREFVASHSIEKHPDRVGNGPEVYNGAKVKQSVDARHGHIPNPKSKNQYKQANEEFDSFNSGVESPNKGSTIQAGLDEKKDEREYGYEGDMAITQLKTICRNAEHLMKMLKSDTDLPEWVQSKITKAEDYISTAHDYLMSEMNEEAEQIDEARNAPAVGSHHKVDEDGNIGHHVVTGVHDGVVYTQNVKTKEKFDYPLRHWPSSSSPIREEVELSEAKCNMTEAGKMCEVHGKKACPKEGEESASDLEPRYSGKKKEGRQLITDKKTISEVLTKKTPVGKVISDFKKSDDPRFEGDSKEKRKERALAAWYKMHPEKSKKKMKEESSPADTTITFPSGNSRERFKL
jgi:hypothetical protein